MTLAALALAASLAPLCLPWAGQGELALGGGRVGAWVLLPWLSLAGLPRRDAPSAALVAALALPVLGLGAAADLRAERALADVALTAVAGLATLALLAHAARRAQGARLHAGLWLALLPGAAALSLACGLAGWRLARDGAAQTPLAWCARAAAGAGSAPPWGALAAAALLAGAAELGRRGAEARP